MLNPRQVITALKQNIGKVIVGKDEVIELLLIAMLCKGHVLIEDVPMRVRPKDAIPFPA